MSIVNYKNPYWTSSANLGRPEEISSNLALHAKYEEFEKREDSPNLRRSSSLKSGHPV